MPVGVSNAFATHSQFVGLDYASAGHTGFAATGVANTFTATQTIRPPTDADAGLVVVGRGATQAGKLMDLRYNDTITAFSVDHVSGVGVVIVADAALGGFVYRCSQFEIRNQANDENILRFVRSSAWVDSVAMTYIQAGVVNWHFSGRTLAGGRGAIAANNVQVTTLDVTTLPAPTATFEVVNGVAGQAVVKLRGASGQTGRHVELTGLSSTGTERLRAALDTYAVDNTDATRKYGARATVFDLVEREVWRGETDGSRGYLIQACHATAPADAMLPVNSAAFYIDAGVLKAKYKDGAGTVSTFTLS